MIMRARFKVTGKGGEKMEKNDIQRLFGKKDPLKPLPKKYKKSIYWGLGAFLTVSIIVFGILMGTKEDFLIKIVMSVAPGGIVGSVIGFLHFKLVH